MVSCLINSVDNDGVKDNTHVRRKGGEDVPHKLIDCSKGRQR